MGYLSTVKSRKQLEEKCKKHILVYVFCIFPRFIKYYRDLTVATVCISTTYKSNVTHISIKEFFEAYRDMAKYGPKDPNNILFNILRKYMIANIRR